MHLDRLNSLRTATFLKQWSPGVSQENIAKTRSVIEHGIDEMLILGSDASEAARIQALSAIVRSLNDADDGFICTLEREDLCDFFFAMGEHEGISDRAVQEVLEERDW